MSFWEDKNLFDRVFDRLAQRKRGYVKFNVARDTIVDNFRPDLGSDITADGDGSFFGENIYDGIAPWAVGVMATGFQGGLVSAEADWLMHRMEQSELADNDRLDLWLQSVKVHISGAYQKSNFYRVLPPFVKDGISIGSPVMFIEEEFVHKKKKMSGIIKFLPQHYKTVFVFYNKYNEAEGVIVEDKTWTTKQIVDMFAPSMEEAKAKLCDTVYNDLKSGQHHTEHTIIRAVFKGNDKIWNVPGFKKPDREWVSVYFENTPKEEKKNEPLRSEGYFSQPFVVWDYDKKPWESISRTPAFAAIYDVISQQQIKRQQLDNLQLKNNPPRQVNTDYRNIVNFNPEGITPVAAEDWDKVAKMFDVVGDIKLSKDELESNAQNIKRWFHTDKFLKFTDLTSTLKQQPSATQIIKIAAELAVQTNPGISTFTGFLGDVDDRVLDIESRAGRGPFAPDIMAEISEIVITNSKQPVSDIGLMPIFVGPLARAQKVKQELDPILDGLGALAPLFEIWPDLKFAIREYGTAEDILKATNYPLKNLVPEDEYNQIIKELNEARARVEQQASLIEAAKVSKDISGTVEPDSVLGSLAGVAG